jgi:hypothetical protein
VIYHWARVRAAAIAKQEKEEKEQASRQEQHPREEHHLKEEQPHKKG